MLSFHIAVLEGQSVRISLTDFPANNLYTVIVGEAEFDFAEWPSAWIKTTNKKAHKSNGLHRGLMVKAI